MVESEVSEVKVRNLTFHPSSKRGLSKDDPFLLAGNMSMIQADGEHSVDVSPNRFRSVDSRDPPGREPNLTDYIPPGRPDVLTRLTPNAKVPRSTRLPNRRD